MEAAFKAQIEGIFGTGSKFEEWLRTVQILNAEEFALMAPDEKSVDAEAIEPAKAAGVHAPDFSLTECVCLQIRST